MNSPVNINEIYKNEEKGKYVIKSFGRWRHQSQFTKQKRGTCLTRQ